MAIMAYGEGLQVHAVTFRHCGKLRHAHTQGGPQGAPEGPSRGP